jgi:hypothetical protein
MTRRTVLGALLVLAALPLGAQRAGQNSTYIHNVPYDGRFTYPRIKYETAGGTMGFGGFRGQRIMWNHDYQNSDLHFPKILETVSTTHVRSDESNVFTFDDPELFKFPIAYLCEVGYWVPNDAELLGVRKYLAKGGFLIIDDFGGYDWDNFATQLARIFPKARPIRLDLKHPVFNSFFAIKSLEVPENYRGGDEEFYGVFEDNDPTKRMMMIINYNFDVSEYWEFSATGVYAIAPTNEAYKFGVNYVMYTLSH